MKSHKINFLIFILIFITIAVSLNAQYDRSGRKIIFDKSSHYYRIVVYDENNYRYLIFGNNVHQTKMDLNKPDRVMFEYARTKLTIWDIKKDIKSTLLLGLGGGNIIKYIQKYYPDVEIDIAEIDPMVIDVAKQYFDMKLTSKTKAFAYDGRIFIRRVQKKYDIMMLDAFNSDYIPFHLMTREYLREVKSKLNPKGFVLQNIWTSNELMKRILTTYKSEFKYVYLCNGTTTLNAVILASNEKPDFSTSNIEKAYNNFQKKNITYPFDFKGTLKRFTPYNDGINTSLILTDDHAPVNYYHGSR